MYSYWRCSSRRTISPGARPSIRPPMQRNTKPTTIQACNCFLCQNQMSAKKVTNPATNAPVSTDQPAQRPRGAMIRHEARGDKSENLELPSRQNALANGKRNNMSMTPVHRKTQLPHIQSVVRKGSGSRNQKAKSIQNIYVAFISLSFLPVPILYIRKARAINTRGLSQSNRCFPSQAKSCVSPMPMMRPPHVI